MFETNKLKWRRMRVEWIFKLLQYYVIMVGLLLSFFTII